jgi:hypothetical protein
VRVAKIFVAVLGASNYTFAQARFSEALRDWIGAHVDALASLGGVPKAPVCDNLKAGVTVASRKAENDDLVTRIGAEDDALKAANDNITVLREAFKDAIREPTARWKAKRPGLAIASLRVSESRYGGDYAPDQGATVGMGRASVQLPIGNGKRAALSGGPVPDQFSLGNRMMLSADKRIMPRPGSRPMAFAT